MSASVAHYVEAFDRAAPNLPGAGAPAIVERRREALARFREMGFPGPREEHWKYTRVAPIEKRRFALAGDAPGDVPARGEALLAGLVLDGPRLVFVDGRCSAALSSLHGLGAGVQVGSLAGALATPEPALQAHLGQCAHAGRHAFTALNTAFMTDGAYIRVAPDVEVSRPIELVFLASAKAADTVTHPRMLIVAENGARVSVLETYLGLDPAATYFTNALTEVILGEGASVAHHKIQREGEKAYHVSTIDAHQAHASRFESHNLSFGARLARTDIGSTLAATQAHCVMNGLFVAGARQHVDFHTNVEHAQPQGTSGELFKGILSGRARGVFNGRVHVHPNAQKTDATQASHNLLLSPDAEIDTKPQLEIYADDVKCAHGATVGQLDEQALFYMRARGIEPEVARDLLIYGFAKEVFETIGDKPIRRFVEQTIVEHLSQSGTLGGLMR